MTKPKKLTTQLRIAILLTLAGIILIFAGFCVKPLGEIHNSVLIAFGEMSTFAGALFGVDYSYRYKYMHLKPPKEEEDKPLTPDYPND